MSPGYSSCALCPRACGVNREEGNRGFCGEAAELRIASASIHRGEEPPVTGKGGSGTVFITGCNLGCIFCQNHQISREGMGRAVSTEEFASICLDLEKRGAENINIVTGSHAAPAITRGIRAARKKGLALPLLWNSSAYEGGETLALLKDWVDVYLPDLKTLDASLGARFFAAPDYPEQAEKAILAMLEARELSIRQGVIKSGLILRHLVLPGFLGSTKKVLRWFARHARGRALLSLMTQYTPPTGTAGSRSQTPARYLRREEYARILEWLDQFGIEDGFCQELITGNEWLPDFRGGNPFSSELSVPVWHWRDTQ